MSDAELRDEDDLADGAAVGQPGQCLRRLVQREDVAHERVHVPLGDQPQELLVGAPEQRRLVLAVQAPVQADDAVVLDQHVVGRRVREAVAGLLPDKQAVRVIDIGSGLGGLVLDLARRSPAIEATGIASSLGKIANGSTSETTTVESFGAERPLMEVALPSAYSFAPFTG